MMCQRSRLLGWLAGVAILAGLTIYPLAGEESNQGQAKSETGVARMPQAWTLDEALSQLRLYPKDAYLQYVALQLARRENRLDGISQVIAGMIGNEDRAARMERANRVDLFSIFTGALAVQESLQLDTMRGETSRRSRPFMPTPKDPPPKKAGVEKAYPEGERARQAAEQQRRQAEKEEKERQAAEEKHRKERVSVADLSGPMIKSHPWEKMLNGRRPAISPLAKCVPDDFYFAEFRSLTKLLDAMDISDLWGTHLFNQTGQEARSQLVGDRLKKQLAVETNRLVRPFYDLVVEEVAVTGSDLFAREGSDVTLLFRFKQPEVFKARMDGFLANAAKSRPDAQRTSGKYLGIDYVHLATPDRAIHVFSAYPSPDLHVRSNSKVAFQRILEAIQGRGVNGKPIRRLGGTAEFAYIRTLLPRGAPEEDGFVYLSDPFIRRLVGPELKLTERRRMVCYNHLRMIGHAALLYRTEHGKAPESLKALVESQCAPGLFGEGNLTCPDGGRYTLCADGMTGICSHHGHAHALTPCCEIRVTQVSGEEADEYKAFREEYNRYWRTFFDPIALRIQISPQRYRLETIVLPLIDNSIYTGLARVLGGKPEPLDALPVPRRNIFSVAVRLNKEDLLQKAGLIEEPPARPAAKKKTTAADYQCADNLMGLARALHDYHATYGKFPAVANFDKQNKPLLSWRVHILPYLGEVGLYNEFHFNEPWDSDHNKKLIARMPAVYRCPGQKSLGAGKTTYLAPVGKATMFTGDPKGLRFTDVVDGTSFTIFIVDADDKHAVTWTKPEDLKYDPEQPLAGLIGRHKGVVPVLFVDGSVHFLRDTINKKTLQALFTRNGGEVVPLGAADEIVVRPPEMNPGRGLHGSLGIQGEAFEKLKLQELLLNGLGNQVSLHVYDAVPLFDFSLPRFLGMVMGSWNGPGVFFRPDEMGIAFVVASINAPVYIGVPVQDAKIVDDFLTRLDSFLAVHARQRENLDFFSMQQEFYNFPLDREKTLRSYTVRFGPVKWRFLWRRIGKGLYLASKPFILEDLQALEAARVKELGIVQAADLGPQAHAMIRLRPQNWNQVLADYRLGWAENNREACLQNLGPLSSIARSLTARGQPPGAAELHRFADQLYGVHFFCPEGGRYLTTPDGKVVTCSVHGSALAPRQPLAPAGESASNKLLRDFTGMTVALTFLDDGLHAVVVVDRK
jgi:prepilin-type processing-associated H-X9-DG protein